MTSPTRSAIICRRHPKHFDPTVEKGCECSLGRVAGVLALTLLLGVAALGVGLYAFGALAAWIQS